MRGDVRGTWIDGRARICEDDEAAHGQQLLTQKYGLLKLFGRFLQPLAAPQANRDRRRSRLKRESV